MNLRAEIHKGSIELIVLNLLNGKGMYGYEIARHMEAIAGEDLMIGGGTLYPLLHRLESQGFIRSRLESATGRRMKRVYTITPKGRRNLKTRRSYWSRLAAAVRKSFAAPTRVLRPFGSPPPLRF